MSDDSRERTQWRVSPLGGWKLRGKQALDRSIVSITLMGGLNADLSEATITSGVRLTKWSLVGGVRLTVPPGTRIDAGGFNVLGRQRVDVQSAGEGPILHVRNYGLLGGTDIRSR
jgi:hypothetical protein